MTSRASHTLALIIFCHEFHELHEESFTRAIRVNSWFDF